MTLPVVGNVATDNYSSATSSPAATMPTGITTGALLITHLIADSGTSLTITPPSGWTLAFRNSYQATTLTQAVYTRVADGTESSTYTYTLGTSQIVSIETFIVTGQGSTFSDVTASANSGNSTSPVATGITTVTNDALGLTFFGAGSGTYTPGLPTSWTNVTSGNTGARGWRIASLGKTTAGAISDATSSLGAARTWVASMWAIRPNTGTAYTQSVAGTLTDSGALTKQSNKPLAGTLTDSGALTKRASKALAGALTSAGAITRQAQKALAGTLTDSGALTRQSGKATSGTLTDSGTLTKQTNTSKAGTLTSSGALSAIRTVLKALAGTLTSAGALARQISTSKAGTLTSAGSISKQTNKSVAGTLTESGALAAIRTILKALAGTLTSAGALIKQTSKPLAGTLTDSGALTKAVATSISGVLTSAGTLARQTGKAVSGTLTSAGAIVRQTFKSLVGALTSSGIVTAIQNAVPTTFRGGLRARDARLTASDGRLSGRDARLTGRNINGDV